MTALGMIRPIDVPPGTRQPEILQEVPAQSPMAGCSCCVMFAVPVALMQPVTYLSRCLTVIVLSRLRLPISFQLFFSILRDSNTCFSEPRLIASILGAPRQIHASQSNQIPLAREALLFYTFINCIWALPQLTQRVWGGILVLSDRHFLRLPDPFGIQSSPATRVYWREDDRFWRFFPKRTVRPLFHQLP